jgi:hypothetical protein
MLSKASQASKGLERYVLVPESKVVASHSLSSPPGVDCKRDAAIEDSKEIKVELSLPTVPSPMRSMGVALASAVKLPPVLEATPRLSHVYRFAASANSSLTITMANLLGAFGGVCTVANSKVQPWASSFRIRSLTIWPAYAASGNYTFVDWVSAGSSGYVPDTASMINIPDGITVTTALRFKPPRGSLAGHWLNPVTISSSAVVFGCTVKIGSVLDLDVEYTLSNISEAGNITVTAGTLGLVYYLALDGPSSNKLVPQGLPTTA